MKNSSTRIGLLALVLVLVGQGCLTNSPASTDTRSIDSAATTSPTSTSDDAVEMENDLSVTGVVILKETGQPLPGISVVTSKASGFGTTDITDSQGKFSLNHSLLRGSNQIYAISAGGFLQSGEITVSPGGYAKLQAEMVEFRKEIEYRFPEATYTPAETARIKIRLIDKKTQQPVPGIAIAFDSTAIQSCAFNKTDANGIYTCDGISPGIYQAYSTDPARANQKEEFVVSVTEKTETFVEIWQ